LNFRDREVSGHSRAFLVCAESEVLIR
jgi:hypothetical protein